MRKPQGSVISVLLVTFMALLAGCTPPGPRALLQGQKLIEQGKFPEAVVKLEAATAILATNAQAWNYLGLACQYSGRAAEAEKAYQRAILLDHNLNEAHYNLGCLWLEGNRPEAAKTELTTYILSRGNSLEALLKLGSAQLRSGEVPAAEKSFEDALHLLPENPEALNGLGLARIQRRRAIEAGQFFSRALKQRPGFAPALLNLAVVQQQQLKEPQLALQNYRAYLALKPTPPNTEPVLAAVRQLELEVNPPRAAPTNAAMVVAVNPPVTQPKPPISNVTRIAVAPKPAPPPALTKPSSAPGLTSNAPKATLASAPPSTSKLEVVKIAPEPVFKPAQDVVTDSNSTQPSIGPAPAQLSTQSTETTDRTATAVGEKPGFLHRMNPAHLFRGESKAPLQITPLPSADGSPKVENATPSGDTNDTAPAPAESSSAHYAYKSPPRPVAGDRAAAERAFAEGAKAQDAKKPAEAERAYRAAAQLDPSYFEAQFNLGWSASEARHYTVALGAYEQALAIRPESVDARYHFAIALKQENHFTEAANELEKVLAGSPNETRAHLALGNLYARQLQQPAKARAHYQKVLQADPRHPQAAAIRYWLADNPP